jgi:sporulation protein YlmC with PRC-barrel domain
MNFRRARLLLVAIFLLTFISAPLSSANTPVVRIVDKSHLNADGTLRKNDLAQSLLPEGKLGRLIFTNPNSTKTFVIDAALIDEVLELAKSAEGEEPSERAIVAENWLYRLKFGSADNTVVALPYGNPDERLLKRIAPSELRFYTQYAQTKLEEFLGRPVLAQNGWSAGRSRISSDFIGYYTENRRLLTGLGTLTNAPELTDLRARLAIPLNPLLDAQERSYFTFNNNKAVDQILEKLKVTAGRYQITSANAQLPITLVNGFDTTTVVSVSLIPMNSRIQIENVNNITLAPKSRQQILVPVDVIAPGSTLVNAQLINTKGQLVGQVSKLEINATIIDSRVAWFTTGAAVLLLLGAITQSVRRIRRSRHEK